jgi:hypothetical protein
MGSSNNQVVGTSEDDVTVFAHNFNVQVKAGWVSRASGKLQV